MVFSDYSRHIYKYKEFIIYRTDKSLLNVAFKYEFSYV